MDQLIKLIGHEYTVKKISRTLCDLTQELHPEVVGAMHITCADETEYECALAFQKGFVQHHLPQLKFAHQSPFRISNLGGRYERGAISIAEEHFVLPKNSPGFKLFISKINSHVGVTCENSKESYGILKRYGKESTCCGALAALMAGKQGQFLDELRELFCSEGKDRLSILLNPEQVAPQQRSLYAAVISSILQARQVMQDIRDHVSSDPVMYLVLPCVTFNRPDIDTEILCGFFIADFRSDYLREKYVGLGDDPSTYSFTVRNQRIIIES